MAESVPRLPTALCSCCCAFAAGPGLEHVFFVLAWAILPSKATDSFQGLDLPVLSLNLSLEGVAVSWNVCRVKASRADPLHLF